MGIFDFLKRKAPAPQKRRFAAARVDRLTAGWFSTNATINEELRGDIDALRMRSREMAQNNDLARRFVKLVARNVVGSNGVILQARVKNPDGTPDTLANGAIETAWFIWCKRGSAEIGGRQSFADLQRAIMQTVARDGEALVGIVRGKAVNNPEGLAFQLIDTGRLDTRKNRTGSNAENAILMGVEIDAYTRPVAYWLRDNPTAGDSHRVPAGDLLHIFLPDNPEQVRGAPWMHASMLAMHDLGEFTRSAMLNARRSADVLGYLVSPDGTGAAMGDEVDAEGQPLKINAPGTYDVLPEGYDIHTPNFAYPNTIFEPFTKAIMRRVASGLDVAAHNLTGDMTDVTYSSARIAELEERDQWMTLQGWFIDAFLEPVFGMWFARAMTAGVLTMPNGSALPIAKADKFRAHEWQARRWAWVDPMKDIEAARLAIKSGIASPQMIAAQNGVDIEDVIDSIGAFEKLVAAKGVTLVDYEVTQQPAPAPAPDPANAKTLEAVEAMQRKFDTEMRVMGVRLDRPAEVKLPDVVVKAGDVHVHNQQPEPAKVEIKNEVNVPETAITNVVNVPEAEVRVEAIMPEQTVTVENHVHTPDHLTIDAMPTRKTTSTVERNASGNITTTHQVEADA